MSSSPAVTEVLSADGASCALVGISGGRPSEESIDYVHNKTQFQLHTMMTEQRHPKTMNLSQTIAKDAATGLQQLLSVDDDITAKLSSIVCDSHALGGVRSIQLALERCLREKRRVYFYGCGATGRLAKAMESMFWRPFWRRLRASPLWSRISPHVSGSIESDCVGEMTGADRALIASLEGFEDLQLIGALALEAHGIEPDDTIIAVTEGGETSSVIGTVRAGLQQWKEKYPQAGPDQTSQHLFFVYNNPSDLLQPFERSAIVLNEPGITKVNLATGPQAITGSTRMQATSTETYVLAVALHCAVDQFLRTTVGLNSEEMCSPGFTSAAADLATLLNDFDRVVSAVKQSIPALAKVTEWESSCYAHKHFTTYFAMAGLMSVFIDSTERSPTFRLFALDTTEQTPHRKCWLQVWTNASDATKAWDALLGRPFSGMAFDRYDEPFRRRIDDPYLRAMALNSLPQAGDDQAHLYDFSVSPQNKARRGGIQSGDLGVLVLVGKEEMDTLADTSSEASKFIRDFTSIPAPTPSSDAADHDIPARVAILIVSDGESAATTSKIESLLRSQSLPLDRISLVVFSLDSTGDPFGIRAQLALKIALNAHSTGVMARLGKVLGNCMVNVSPSNLKLIGRATHLIRAIANEALEKAKLPSVSYPLANAMLYDSIEVIRAEQRAAVPTSSSSASAAGAQSAEVALSIVRLLASIEKNTPVAGEEALNTLATKGLATFIEEFNARHAAAAS